MVIKTFFIKHHDARDILRRIHGLGILDYNVNWGVDLDEKLNAITFRISCTSGAGAREKENEIVEAIESFIKSIDIEQKPDRSE